MMQEKNIQSSCKITQCFEKYIKNTFINTLIGSKLPSIFIISNFLQKIASFIQR